MHAPGNDDHTFAKCSHLNSERGRCRYFQITFAHENDDHAGKRAEGNDDHVANDDHASERALPVRTHYKGIMATAIQSVCVCVWLFPNYTHVRRVG